MNKIRDTENCKINQGVQRGCILSPALFNLYAEGVMRQAGAEDGVGLKCAGWMKF